jgi:hypothetical protein
MTLGVNPTLISRTAGEHLPSGSLSEERQVSLTKLLTMLEKTPPVARRKRCGNERERTRLLPASLRHTTANGATLHRAAYRLTIHPGLRPDPIDPHASIDRLVEAFDEVLDLGVPLDLGSLVDIP